MTILLTRDKNIGIQTTAEIDYPPGAFLEALKLAKKSNSPLNLNQVYAAHRRWLLKNHKEYGLPDPRDMNSRSEKNSPEFHARQFIQKQMAKPLNEAGRPRYLGKMNRLEGLMEYKALKRMGLIAAPVAAAIAASAVSGQRPETEASADHDHQSRFDTDALFDKSVDLVEGGFDAAEVSLMLLDIISQAEPSQAVLAAYALHMISDTARDSIIAAERLMDKYETRADNEPEKHKLLDGMNDITDKKDQKRFSERLRKLARDEKDPALKDKLAAMASNESLQTESALREMRQDGVDITDPPEDSARLQVDVREADHTPQPVNRPNQPPPAFGQPKPAPKPPPSFYRIFGAEEPSEN